MINLKSRYGQRYKIGTEEGGGKADPWAMLLLCRHGHIYLHGAKLLGAATRSRGPVAKRLAALPCVQVWQDGSDGLNVVFDPKHFDAVAEVMKPRTRKRLSAEHIAKLKAAGKLFKSRSGNAGEELERAPTSSGGCEAA